VPRLEDFYWIGVQEPNVYNETCSRGFVYVYPARSISLQMMGELTGSEDRILMRRRLRIWQQSGSSEQTNPQYSGDFRGSPGRQNAKVLGLNIPSSTILKSRKTSRSGASTGPEVSKKPPSTR